MKHPSSPIEETLEDELTYKCLACDELFIATDATEVECPKCGTKDEQFLEPAAELEEEDSEANSSSTVS